MCILSINIQFEIDISSERNSETSPSGAVLRIENEYP